MPLEKILERIKKEAQSEATSLKTEAQEKARLILEEGEMEAQKLSSRIVGEKEREGKEEARRLLALKRLETRDEILAEKRRLLEEVFESALDEISKLPEEKYLSIMKNLLLNLPLSGEEELIVSPSERNRFNASFIDEVNEELKGKGKKGNLKLSSQTRDIKGGFILRSEKLEIDCTLPTLLGELRSEIEAQVLKILLA